MRVDDLRVEMNPWGFDPGVIGVPSFLWQGDDDSFTTPDDVEAWSVIPGLDVRLLPGEGHLLPFTHGAEIVTTLLKAGR